MPQRRGIVTEQLSNIIQVIQLGKKTGRLSVEREEGAQREEGMVLFSQGLVTEAMCGQMRGHVALERLYTWGRCRFIFEAADPERSNGSVTPQLSPTQDLALYPTQRQRAMREDERPRPLGPSRSGQYPNPTTQTSDKQIDAFQFNKVPAVQPPLAAVAFIPRRTRQDEEGMRLLTQAGLSHLHLRLYLLTDGRRNIAELMRLLGRSSEEVQQLLFDLKRLGIIHY